MTDLLALPDSIWDKIDFTGDCWLWRGSRSPKGYGKTKAGTKFWRVHRLMYSGLVGPIPEGLVIHHICENPPCCNPEHLIATTQQFNVLAGHGLTALAARRTHCIKGHPLKWTTSQRYCPICTHDRTRRYREEAKRERAAA